MITVICDRCGKDCELNAFEIKVSPIHNPTPTYPFAVGDLKITDTHEPYRFILCQHCYKRMGFPNYYEVMRTKELKFREMTEVPNES